MLENGIMFWVLLFLAYVAQYFEGQMAGSGGGLMGGRVGAAGKGAPGGGGKGGSGHRAWIVSVVSVLLALSAGWFAIDFIRMVTRPTVESLGLGMEVVWGCLGLWGVALLLLIAIPPKWSKKLAAAGALGFGAVVPALSPYVWTVLVLGWGGVMTALHHVPIHG